MRIAVDAMGGDQAPREVVRGALAALAEDPAIEVDLVGDEPKVRAEIENAVAAAPPPGAADGDRLRIVHAPEWIEMGEHPVEALRKKKDSSIAVCTRLLGAGEVKALFSAGNTGAVVAAATFALKRIEGVKRPGIALAFATERGPSVIMDVGANLVCKPEHLAQYAVMASCYARAVLGVAEPAVGMLNIGSEEEKGSTLVREAGRLVKAAAGPRAGYRFHGFVEGHDIFRGECDVIVCEAFVGNAMLKVCEGQATAMIRHLKGILAASFPGESEAPRVARALGDLARRFDYTEHGGAPLLGVDGAVVIGHGRSDARAVKNALKVAGRFAGSDLAGSIAASLKSAAEAADAAAPVPASE